MGGQSMERTPFVVNLPLGSPSADADPIPGALLQMPRKWKAKKVYLMDTAGIAKSATDLAVVSLKDPSGNVIAEWDTSDNALVANTPVEMVLDETYSEAIDEGTCTVEYDETDTGTAVALTTAQLQIVGEWVQTAGYEDI